MVFSSDDLPDFPGQLSRGTPNPNMQSSSTLSVLGRLREVEGVPQCYTALGSVVPGSLERRCCAPFLYRVWWSLPGPTRSKGRGSLSSHKSTHVS